MEIIRRDQSIHVEKPGGTVVNYYIRPEYEIHYNELLPGTVQTWHHHDKIEETLLLLEGELEVRWRDDQDTLQSAILKKGDLVRVENTSHSFANLSSSTISFVVFRVVLTGLDYRELIKNDKHIDK